MSKEFIDGELAARGQMSWTAATALLLLSVGLYLTAIRTEIARAFYARYEAYQIISLTTFFLLLTAVGAGLAGAGVVLRQSYAVSQQTLKQAQASKAILFQDTLSAAQNLAERIALLLDKLQPQQLNSLFPWLRDSHVSADGAQKTYQLAALDVLDGDGQKLATLGTLAGTETARIRLQNPRDAWLVWRGGWMLESHVRFKSSYGFSGWIMAHIRLYRRDRLLGTTSGQGRTGALGVCAPYEASAMQSLP